MFPTGLSMLWESTDPRRALQLRFGLDSFDDAVSRLTTGLAQAWAIDVRACDRILISGNNAIAWLRTDRGTVVAKWSRAQDQFGRLAAIADLLQALHEQGLPVAPPLASVDGRHRVVVDFGSSPLSMTCNPTSMATCSTRPTRLQSDGPVPVSLPCTALWPCTGTAG